MTTISTLLVANRGEIAVRIMRTARAMGLRTVAVYSSADRNAMHVREADCAVHIGEAAVAESYLRIDAIIDAAAKTGADAIHPGYGFLSENSHFAEACAHAGLLFLGPSANAIEVMGDKARAKRAMIEAGVPCVPGYQGEDQSLDTLVAEAERIGMPVMVKAAAGGGGRGMRLVSEVSQLSSAITLAQSEAENAFGSRELIIERAVLRPRHVEIQIFADSHGNVVHLGERDCSIQRRHQKVVEESPCPVMTPTLREAMGSAAVDAARAVNYVGAGTVEFLLDSEGQFYFLEMNTRLQVEHPVTELVTGQDLVEWQIRVARGEALPLSQQQLQLRGHAIEVRLYAEDPTAGFLPSTGIAKYFGVPELPGVRLDTGLECGDEVSPFYDAMVAKIIGYGATREDARQRLLAALRSSALLGIQNNRDFLIDVLAQPVFTAGEATTAFIADHYGDAFESPFLSQRELAAAVCIQHYLDSCRCVGLSLSVSPELLGWSSTGNLCSRHHYEVDGVDHEVALTQVVDEYRVAIADKTWSVEMLECADGVAELLIDGQRQRYCYAEEGSATLHLASDTCSRTFTDSTRLSPEAEDAAAGGAVVAPMHGQLLSVDITEGEQVVKGQRVAVLEAMKMQHEITAPVDGVVVQAVAAGQQLAAGDLIAIIEDMSEDDSN